MFINIEGLNDLMGDSEFKINLNGNLNTDEREFLNMIILVFFNLKELEISLELRMIQDKFKMSLSEINSFLEKLSKKSISYSAKIGNDNLQGAFNFLSSYCIYNSKILISLPKELQNANRNSGILKILSPQHIYGFKNRISTYFYGYFLKKFILKKDFEVEYEKLKEIIHVNQKYERFFDFEKNILKKLIEDFGERFGMKYEKIKSGSSINNKVTGIKFFFQDIEISEDNHLNLKNILFLIKNEVNDIPEVYSLLKNAISEYGYDVTHKTCFMAKQRYKKSSLNFDDFLKVCIEKLKENNLLPTILIMEKFSSVQEMKKRFIKELEKIQPGILFDTSFFTKDFLKDLYLLKGDKILKFENEEIKVIINWKKSDITTIKIFQS